MDKIDPVEYNKLFPEKKEFSEWVSFHEKEPLTVPSKTKSNSNSKMEIFDPFNTVNS
jgi:hypothetical protein